MIGGKRRREDRVEFDESLGLAARIVEPRDPRGDLACQRIIDGEARSRIGPSALPAHPAGDGERQRPDPLPARQPIGDRREQALRQFLRSVHRDLPGAVAEARIGEAGHERAAIGGDVEPGRRHQRRRRFIPQRLDEAGISGRGDHLMDEIETGQAAEIGDRAMRPVQQAKLRRLPGRDIGRDPDADGREIGPRAGEAILDHPLPEGLGLHHRAIDQADARGQCVDVRLLRRGHDPIHHRLRKGAPGRDPVGGFGIAGGEHGVAQASAVARQVVARNRGEGGQPPFPAKPQRGGDEIGGAPAPRIGEIALFGDGQRDDVGRRRGERLDEALGAHDIADGADHPHALADDEAVEEILRRHRLAHRGGAERGADDAPVHILEQGGELRAMEGADADMDGARRRPRARPHHPGRQSAQRRFAQPRGHNR